MENANFSHEHLEPTNGEEKSNLQSNSEENTQSESTDKKSPTRDPELFKRIIEEIERKEAEEEQKPEIKPVAPTRDPNIWERKSEEDDPTPTEGEEENVERTNEKDPGEDDDLDIRDYKGSNRKLATFGTIRSQKQKKYERLVSEMNDHKADLKRGYKIIENSEGQINHIPITSSEKDVISFKISDLDYERFMLRIEIQELDNKIKKLANRKRTHRISKKNKVSKSRQEDKLVQQVSVNLDKASKNGNKKIVSKIKQQVQLGYKNDAYDSLKSFLSQQVKTVAKKLDKDEKLEKNVLDRVIDKISASQS